MGFMNCGCDRAASNYRILYFFITNRQSWLANCGLIKERKVPPIEIELSSASKETVYT